MTKQKKEIFIKEQKLIQPSFKQFVKIGWSILWRYIFFGMFSITFFYIGYMFGISYFVDFYSFLISLDKTLTISGYREVLILYSWPLSIIFLMRIAIGFIVTYVIFMFISRVKYKDFSFSLNGPSLMSHDVKKGLLLISWAFYWRGIFLMLTYFAVFLMFMRPESLMDHFWYLMLGFVGIFFVIILLVLKLIINKSFCCFTLIATEKTLPN